MNSTSGTSITGRDLETPPDEFWKNIKYLPNKNELKKEPWVYLKRRVLWSREEFPDSSDPSTFIECKFCGFRGREIGRHLTDKHGVDSGEYGNTKCQEILDEMSKRITGEKNPAYQHGGKFSPFSDKFIKYQNGDADYTKEDIQRKKEQTSRENPQNQNTKIEYYLKQGLTELEAAEALSERQTTFSKEKCIQRYGENKGSEIWRERQERWQNTLNSKSPKEIEEINRKKAPKINFHHSWNLNLTDPGIFYILKTPKGIKIGITSRGLRSRYGSYLKECEIILEHPETISNCFKIEQLIKMDEKLKDHRIKEKFSGWTETFTCPKETIIEVFNSYKENFNEQFSLKYPRHSL